MVLVARGTQFKSATVVHGMQLSEDEVKVSVDEMIIPNASVPLVTYEIFTVEQAFKSFIAWPKHLVGSVSDPPKKIPLSEDDPLASLHLLADILEDKPLEVEYDANVFGTGSEVPIYLHSQDVRELASGTEELNISIIQLWMINKLGRSDDYGFIDPQSIHESNDFDQINIHLTRSFASGKKIYFLPYISGFLLCLYRRAMLYGSANCTGLLPHISDKQLIASMMMIGRLIANSKKLAWISLKCNRQNGSYECGYYVMYWMTHIVCSHITRGWETRFKTTTPVPEKPLSFMRKAAAKLDLDSFQKKNLICTRAFLRTVLPSTHRQAFISPQGSTALTVFQGCRSVTVNRNSYAFPFRRLERTYPETAVGEVREKYVCDWILDVDNVWRDEVLQDLGLL
ncbi:hypothetical protein V8G54_030472 [Vigna mungo]|uniref:DUF8039 domain-containing protein n=1 Tax=Vigna mungo TaxID=3915 RepID=A0AAQ3RLB4_VIGMU